MFNGEIIKQIRCEYKSIVNISFLFTTNPIHQLHYKLKSQIEFYFI